MKDLVLKEKLWLYENRTELATNQDKFLSFMKKISDKNRYKELFARKDYDPKKLKSFFIEIFGIFVLEMS